MEQLVSSIVVAVIAEISGRAAVGDRVKVRAGVLFFVAAWVIQTILYSNGSPNVAAPLTSVVPINQPASRLAAGPTDAVPAVVQVYLDEVREAQQNLADHKAAVSSSELRLEVLRDQIHEKQVALLGVESALEAATADLQRATDRCDQQALRARRASEAVLEEARTRIQREADDAAFAAEQARQLLDDEVAQAAAERAGRDKRRVAVGASVAWSVAEEARRQRIKKAQANELAEEFEEKTRQLLEDERLTRAEKAATRQRVAEREHAQAQAARDTCQRRLDVERVGKQTVALQLANLEDKERRMALELAGLQARLPEVEMEVQLRRTALKRILEKYPTSGIALASTADYELRR